MATVWAAHIGTWVPSYGSGWSHTFEFHDLPELTRKLSAASPSLKGTINKLGIVADGDKPGVVVLDRDLTPVTLPLFTQEFQELKQFLTPYARVIFFSCIAGAGEDGTKLLKGLSQGPLPDRYVIGFEVYGRLGKLTFPHEPGQVDAQGEDVRGFQNWPRLSKWDLEIKPPGSQSIRGMQNGL